VNRLLWLTAAAVSAVLAIASVLLTVWLQLQPCHLCIFQRLLFMMIAVFALVAAFTPALLRRVAGVSVGLLAAAGAWTAAYQSWLQQQPPGSVSCIGGELGPIEQLVEWLGQRLPALFLATGFCEDEALVILGLSLVNWSLICFLAVLGLALWLTANAARRSHW
jgi:disulfide bond formation protein DsbB